MSSWLIALCGLIYLGVSIDQGLKGNWPMCVTTSDMHSLMSGCGRLLGSRPMR